MAARAITVHIKLNKKKWIANFIVVDGETNLPIEGVTISVVGKDIVTDTGGLASVGQLLMGTYTFTAEHPDYDLYSNSFIVG